MRPGDLRRGRSTSAATTGRSRGREPAAGPARARPRGRSRVGERFDVVVGPVAHGGHCVVRLPEPEARVVFVRHAIPGERVTLEITEGTEGDRFWRADAVEVLEASPDRVAAPCPFAGPGRVRRLRLPARGARRASARSRPRSSASSCRRLAGLDVDVTVEAGARATRTGCAGGPGSGSSPLPDGRRGMRKHRSHDVVPVDDCLIAGAPPTYVVRDVAFEVAADGFWQVHPGAPETLVDAVLEVLDAAAGGVGARPVRRRRAVRPLPRPTRSAPGAGDPGRGRREAPAGTRRQRARRRRARR